MTVVENALRLRSSFGVVWDIDETFDEVLCPVLSSAGITYVFLRKPFTQKRIDTFKEHRLCPVPLYVEQDMVSLDFTGLKDLEPRKVLRAWFKKAHLGYDCQCIGELSTLLTKNFVKALRESNNELTHKVIAHTPPWLRAMTSVTILLEGQRHFVGNRRLTFRAEKEGLRVRPFERWPGSFLMPLWSVNKGQQSVTISCIDGNSKATLLDPIIGTIENIPSKSIEQHRVKFSVPVKAYPQILLVTEENPGPQILDITLTRMESDVTILEWLSSCPANGLVCWGKTQETRKQSFMQVAECPGCRVELPAESDAKFVSLELIKNRQQYTTWEE